MLEVETRIGKRFTIIIPKHVREMLGLREGQRLRIHVEDGKIVIEPLPVNPLSTYSLIINKIIDVKEAIEKAGEWVMSNASG